MKETLMQGFLGSLQLPGIANFSNIYTHIIFLNLFNI